MEAVYPSAASALARGRRARRSRPRSRHRTVPVTFAEIKEVDEENEESQAAPPERERRRRPDILDDQLARFAEFRRRRARLDVLRERADAEEPAAGAGADPAGAGPADHAPPSAASRAGSEPNVLKIVDT